VSDPISPDVFYGREREVARLSSSGAPLTILSGDSGMGKSSVLEAAQRATADAITPPPRTVPYSGGVLQRIMLEALSAVLAQDAESRGSLSVAARELGEAVEQLIDQGGQALLRVIGKELLAFVRGQLGEEAGAAIAAYAETLKHSIDEQLAVRLTNALDREAAAMMILLGEEVRERLSIPRIVIALDAGERLGKEDVSVLADLANDLPEGIRIRLAVAIYDAGRQQTVEQLRAVGDARVAEIPVSGIEDEGIAAWLEDAGLPARRVELAPLCGPLLRSRSRPRCTDAPPATKKPRPLRSPSQHRTTHENRPGASRARRP
jgi:AAA ATPase domain